MFKQLYQHKNTRPLRDHCRIKLMQIIVVFCFTYSVCELKCIAEQQKCNRNSDYILGIPQKSDVCFCSRWVRPKDKHDTFNSLKVAQAFGTTRFDWLYITYSQKEFVRKLRRLGYSCGLGLNTILADDPCTTTHDKGRILDVNGVKWTAPWMLGWNVYWGCANHPAYRQSFLAHAKINIDAGATSLHMDDPAMNGQTKGEGCFCLYCMEKFKLWLSEKFDDWQLVSFGIDDFSKFNYREYKLRGKDNTKLRELFVEFQKSSVREFFGWVFNEVNIYAGHKIPFSCNNAGGTYDNPRDMFDFWIGELGETQARPSIISEKILYANSVGKMQIFTLGSYDIQLNRKTIALCYALGGNTLCPFDVYMGDRPRFMGEPKDFNDLYTIPRQYPYLFNNYRNIAIGGYDLNHSRSQIPILEIISDYNEVSYFLSANEKDSSLPKVLHLIDWASKNRDFILKLYNKDFKLNKTSDLYLIRPGIKDKLAWQQTREGYIMKISSIKPWGIIIIP